MDAHIEHIFQIIEEVYDLDPEEKNPSSSIERRICDIVKRKIQIFYHYGKDRLLQPSRSFIIPSDGLASSLTMDMTEGFQVRQWIIF